MDGVSVKQGRRSRILYGRGPRGARSARGIVTGVPGMGRVACIPVILRINNDDRGRFCRRSRHHRRRLRRLGVLPWGVLR